MKLSEFKKIVWEYYSKNRRQMIWRETTDPYKIVVSEVMLQQTQVSRVAQKYPEFIDKFPEFSTLAKTPIVDVLKVWSGMGYNRRALYLKKIAQKVVTELSGKFPNDPKLINELPGIGYATAQSIATFAFNYPGIFIETNIRRVYIHFFFNDQIDVDDKDILPLVASAGDENPREWYYALMDYGAMLSKKIENPNRKSKHFITQSQFEGSDRQMRGNIIKELVHSGSQNVDYLLQKFCDGDRLQRSLKALEREGFIMEEKGIFKIK